jgi:hypothetical protein
VIDVHVLMRVPLLCAVHVMHRPLASRILLTAGFTTPAQRLVARRLWQAVMAQEQVRACACGVRAPVRACACTCVRMGVR